MADLRGAPRKLNDGTWGAFIEGVHPDDVCDGDHVEVTANTGKRWTEAVDRVVSSNEDGTLVALTKIDNGGSRSQPRQQPPRQAPRRQQRSAPQRQTQGRDNRGHTRDPLRRLLLDVRRAIDEYLDPDGGR